MKIIFSLALALSALVPGQAQIFHSAAANGAVIGGIAGAIIGGSSHHDAWQGAALGATTGLIVGSIADSAHYHDVWHGSGGPAPVVYGYGAAHGHYPAAGGYYYYAHPVYHNHGYYHAHAYYPHGYYAYPWYGAVLGASLGYLVGSVVDDHAHYHEAAAAPQPAPAPAPQQPVTIINNYYNSSATPMAAANGLFGR